MRMILELIVNPMPSCSLTQCNTQVTGKGSITDAKGRVNSILQKSQKPRATNIEKGRKETTFADGPNFASNRAGKEFLGQDKVIDRVNVGAGAVNLKGEAVEAFIDTSGATQDAASAAKDTVYEVPPAPGLGLIERMVSKIEDVKGNLPGQ